MREFYIQDDGIRLHAKLDIPEGVSEESGKCPLCIVIHGLTGHMEETHIIGASKALNEEGIATLRVEMYGHGKSEGDFAKHTLYKWLGNAMTVTDYAKALPFVTDLYVMGHSQGGLTTMLLAGLKPDEYYIMSATGTSDFAYPVLGPQIEDMKKQSAFVYTSDFSKGNFWFILANGGEHSWYYVRQYLYNGLPFFFRR